MIGKWGIECIVEDGRVDRYRCYGGGNGDIVKGFLVGERRLL